MSIEMSDYVAWTESVKWSEVGGPAFDFGDWLGVTDLDIPLQYWDEISVHLVPRDCVPTDTRSLLPQGTVACLVADGYVYPLTSWADLDTLQKEFAA